MTLRPRTTNPIDLVAAAYDLRMGATEWLPNLLRAGAPVLNLGQGCTGAIWAGTSDEGEPLISQSHAEDGATDLALRLARVAREIEPVDASPAQRGRVRTLGELRWTRPRMHEALTKRVGCEDMLALWAIDPDFHGVGINMPSATSIELSPKARERWHAIVAHIAAGHRLRRRLGQTPGDVCTGKTSLPLDAEAVIDPKSGTVVGASGSAKVHETLASIRAAAVQADASKGSHRCTDPDEALRRWEGLMRGRWSMVDWFDTDGRRFVLALPNASRQRDPRGLTNREYQVAIRVSKGQNSKGIADDLGISVSQVSQLRRYAMRKLGARTVGHLVAKMWMF